METGHDIKASLSISMQTQDIIGFSSILEHIKIHYTLLIDPGGYNIFHDLASCLINESLLLEFLSILISQFNKRYLHDSGNIIKEMLNFQTLLEKQTPLLQAVKHNRKVAGI
jgi:type IV secretory pathway VirB6-like protein